MQFSNAALTTTTTPTSLELYHYHNTNLVIAMRMELERLRRRELLDERLKELLLVGPLVEISYPLVDEIEATLSRLEHVVVG